MSDDARDGLDKDYQAGGEEYVDTVKVVDTGTDSEWTDTGTGSPGENNAATGTLPTENSGTRHGGSAPVMGPTPVARLYERWTLDVVAAVAPLCATAFETHPQRFKAISPRLAKVLAQLKYRAGNHEKYLSTEQRNRLLSPILGASDGLQTTDRSAGFHRAADALRRTAASSVERAYNTGEVQLRAAFMDSADGLRAYLQTIEGAVVDSALDRTSPQFDLAVAVLQSSTFASGLGVQPAPSGGSWPLGLELSGDGATIVHALAITMDPPVTIGPEGFLVAQRIAHFGAQTLTAIATDRLHGDDKRIDDAIASAYRWWTAIRDLGSTRATANL